MKQKHFIFLLDNTEDEADLSDDGMFRILKTSLWQWNIVHEVFHVDSRAFKQQITEYSYVWVQGSGA